MLDKNCDDYYFFIQKTLLEVGSNPFHNNGITSIQRMIVRQIVKNFPLTHILESPQHASYITPGQDYWIINPMSGIENHSKGNPHYAISLSLGEVIIAGTSQSAKLQTILSGVYAPALGLLYTAKRGHGAFLQSFKRDGRTLTLKSIKKLLSQTKPSQIFPSSIQYLRSAILLTELSCVGLDLHPNNYLYLGHLISKIKGFRSFAATALDLCYIAEGSYEGYWGIGSHFYEIAASCLILKEAGVLYTDFYNTLEDFPASLVVAPIALHRQVIETLQESVLPYNGFRPLLKNIYMRKG